MVGHQIRLRGDDNFSSWQNKRINKSSVRVCGLSFFCVKWCTVQMHNAMTQSGLETNSSGDVSVGKEKAPLLQWICRLKNSGLMIFYICYHAGGSTEHFPRPKVKLLKEESSPSDASTPKKRKTGFAGKMRTYIWACPLTPTPNFIFLPLAFVK